MNYDIFYWSLLADHLQYIQNFSHIVPGGQAVLNYFSIDAWGTSFILAFIAKCLQCTAIEAIPYFQAIFFLVLISLVIFEMIQMVFHYNKKISFFIAFLMLC